MPDEPPEETPQSPSAGTRRDFLYLATGAVVTVAAGAAIWPLIDQMNPAADTRALASIEVNLAPIELGQRITVKWRGKPIFIAHRTEASIRRARADDHNPSLPDPATDASRVKKPHWLIVIGICTHLGCIPLGQKKTDPRGPWGGWFCPCHGSIYDLSGRIRQGPAPKNLYIPPYKFTAADVVKIG